MSTTPKSTLAGRKVTLHDMTLRDGMHPCLLYTSRCV